MALAGFVRTSFVDYPGCIASVLFLPGCNWDCFFCHNRGLLAPEVENIDEAEVWQFLYKRRLLLDGVVITGGEPTLSRDLPDLLERCRVLGLRRKLDTNGSRPDVVEELLRKHLLSYVALDIKARFQDYPAICGSVADPVAVQATLSLLRASGVPFECRTTFLPQLSLGDIAALAQAIAPVPRWALQVYRPPERYRPEDRFRVLAPGHGLQDIRRAIDVAKACGGEVILRD